MRKVYFAGALVFALCGAVSRADQPWWDQYPLFVETGDPAKVLTLNGDCGFGTNYADPSWGIYVQKTIGAGNHTTLMHANDLKYLTYYETFGTTTAFILELGTRTWQDYDPVYRFYWSWNLIDTAGGTFRWAGPQNYFDAESFCGPYTRLHSTYGAGGRAMTYPDGTEATGYIDGDVSDPRKSRVIDAGASKGILGDYAVDYGYMDDVAGNPLREGGLLTVNVNGADHLVGHFSFGKDTACPMWIDQVRSSILFGVDQGDIDGIWTDNFSPWDNFGYPPLKVAFGDWSVAGFRDYLSAHFTPAELTAMGVTDVTTFDIRAHLRSVVTSYGGTDTNLNDGQWNNAAWLDEPLWRAYKIYKRQVGTQALSDFYTTVKDAAAQMGKPELPVLGNDIPVYSLGYARGDLDVVSTELSPGWHMGTSSRGFMIPPVGRFAPHYKLGVEHAKSRLMNVWLYMTGDYYQYKENPGVMNTLYYEMLANGALPMYHVEAGYTEKCTQNETVNAGFFGFVRDTRATFGQRVPVDQVALYYSSSSVLSYMTPLGFHDMENQPHAGAYNGWGTALTDMHYQYRALPEWKLTSDALAGVNVLIIANAQALDPGDVTSIIDPWVRAGGCLVVTGDSGLRLGEAGNFEVNGSGLCLAGLTGVSALASAPATQLSTVGAGRVYYVKDNLGLNYFNASTAAARGALLPGLQEAMNQAMGTVEPMITAVTNLPLTVGVNLYGDQEAGRFFIDVNNYDVDLATDTVTPTPTIIFTVQIPAWLQPAEDEAVVLGQVLTPGEQPVVTMTPVATDRVQVQVRSVDHYASVVLIKQSTVPAELSSLELD